MTREENVRAIIECCFSQTDKDIRETAIKNIVKSLQSENEFISSAEDYRLRLIQIFHNTHCEEFISFMVLPTESDLNMLEDMLREHYKDAEPCEDAVSREEVIKASSKLCVSDECCKCQFDENAKCRLKSYRNYISTLPSVNPTRPKAKWIDDEFGSKCSCCGRYTHLNKFDRPMKFKCCSMCGAEMESD